MNLISHIAYVRQVCGRDHGWRRHVTYWQNYINFSILFVKALGSEVYAFTHSGDPRTSEIFKIFGADHEKDVVNLSQPLTADVLA